MSRLDGGDEDLLTTNAGGSDRNILANTACPVAGTTAACSESLRGEANRLDRPNETSVKSVHVIAGKSTFGHLSVYRRFEIIDPAAQAKGTLELITRRSSHSVADKNAGPG